MGGNGPCWEWLREEPALHPARPLSVSCLPAQLWYQSDKSTTVHQPILFSDPCRSRHWNSGQPALWPWICLTLVACSLVHLRTTEMVRSLIYSFVSSVEHFFDWLYSNVGNKFTFQRCIFLKEFQNGEKENVELLLNWWSHMFGLVYCCKLCKFSQK